MIRVEKLSVTYPDGNIGLRETSLAFKPDQVTVLLGLSGAGKSTLLRALNHLTVPSTGAVIVSNGAPLSKPSALRQHRRQTAMIFQQHQLIARHTALQNVLLGRLGHHTVLKTLLPFGREDREIALQALDRVGLLDRALDRIDRMSGGQQQRVGIARALAQQPRLILADEPVASLDPATSRTVLAQLKRICEEDRIPAIVSLHQIDLARDFAHRIVGLRDGRVIFDSRPDDLGDDVLSRIYGDAARGRPDDALPAVEDSQPRMEAFA